MPRRRLLSKNWRIEKRQVKSAILYRPLVTVTIYGGLGNPIRGSALLDTGADRSAIDEDLATGYGFQKDGEERIGTADGSVKLKPTYNATLSIDGMGGYSRDLVMGACRVQGQGLVALIGCDVLAEGTLFYEGKNNRFTLNLPRNS